MTEYCASKGWVVLYVPEGKLGFAGVKMIKSVNGSSASDWVDSSSSYQYDAKVRIFQQPMLAKQTLQQFSAFNRSILESYKVSRNFEHEKKRIVSGSPLMSLIELGIQDPNIAPRVLEFTLAELEKHESVRGNGSSSRNLTHSSVGPRC